MRIKFFASLLLALLFSGATGAADKADVKEKWHTPYDLYLDPQEAYDMKMSNPERVLLIDVRARGEIQFVGFSDIADANIPIYIYDQDDWKDKKDGINGAFRKHKNSDFTAAMDKLLAARSLTRDTPLVLMCTSGGRSPVAAKVLHEAGFDRVYTQYQGFEGVKSKQGPQKGQRVVNGWKNAGLPWSYSLKKSKMYFNFAPDKAE